uniref:(northern house mosquito) hypothetical protein n=1 Tax=Culex pipiens TaxID=7175 RepID=A0A8D8EZW5_CULPI
MDVDFGTMGQYLMNRSWDATPAVGGQVVAISFLAVVVQFERINRVLHVDGNRNVPETDDEFFVDFQHVAQLRRICKCFQTNLARFALRFFWIIKQLVDLFGNVLLPLLILISGRICDRPLSKVRSKRNLHQKLKELHPDVKWSEAVVRWRMSL